ncbi:hypothetical protein [Terrabacter carboxydivorans]|uniref:Lipoprotein n=1 Tax=Terrabacter carboxydivorans TaxID=619730 RepID=A0ABN3LJ81_9MICO
MLTTRALAALICTLAVAGCSTSGTDRPTSASSSTAPATSTPAPTDRLASGSPSTVAFDDADVPLAKEHCEAYVELNRRVHAQGQKDVADRAAWMDLHDEASADKEKAPARFRGLYAVIELWTLELADTRDGSVSADTKARLGAAVMGNAAICTAAGVTLPIL